MQVVVARKETKFYPDASRVIARHFYTNDERSLHIIQAVLGMSDAMVTQTLNQTLRDYSTRHRNISKIFERNFNKISWLFKQLGMNPESIDYKMKVLIGSYFTHEYSIESTAFFNPSIVEHPDQSDVKSDEKRVILSFRATGEGHISSIVFRTGILDRSSNIELEPVGKLIEEAEHIRRFIYEKSAFSKQLDQMDFHGLIPSALILDRLNDQFTYSELKKCIDEVRKSIHLAADKEALINQIMWLATSHYELQFSLDTNISERAIFPVSANERNGVEDARFVKFQDDDKTVTYYATYTAFDNTTIMPKLLDTKNFYHFRTSPLHGEIAQNKGMALFPRKINGKYAMLCRLDGVNNYVSFSDKVNIWREAKLLQQPEFPWELIQVGNCGSPIETEEGWLMITHGVGPMREYVLGASLLDLHNPEIEIGRLSSPLLSSNTVEREGYVPNVVYSCGSMIHNNDLIIPYAISDYASTYATVNLRELLNALKRK